MSGGEACPPATRACSKASSSAGHGVKYGTLLCKYALEHLRGSCFGEWGIVAPRVVFSLGPRLHTDLRSFLTLLSHELSPYLKAAEEIDVDDFKIEPARGGLVAGAGKADNANGEHGDIWDCSAGAFFFRVAHAAPHKPKVARGSIGIQSNATLAVTKVDVRHLCAATHTLRVALESADGGGSQDILLLTPSYLTTDDFLTLRQWEVADQLVYTFGSEPDEKFGPEYQEVMKGLLAARAKAADAGYDLFQGEDAWGLQRDVLHHMEADGMVSSSVAGDRSTWQLTELGRSKLEVTQLLHKCKPALAVRDAVPLKERTTFELMQILQKDGWACRVRKRGSWRKATKRKHGSGPELEQPEYLIPFEKNGKKQWWLAHNADTVDGFYLQALLCHEQIGQPIKHLQTSGYYQALLRGEEFQPRRKRDEFCFSRAADVGRAAIAKRRRVCKRPSPGQHKVASTSPSSSKEDDQEEEREEAVCEGEHSEESDSSLAEGASSDGKSGASSSSSTNSSSSSSSEEEKTAKAAKAGEAERRPVDFVYGFRWKGFKFTKVWTNGTHTGWEVTCYAQHHFNPKNMCRRTRSFVNQNEDMILRKLKHWRLHDALSRIKQRLREDVRRGNERDWRL